MDSKLKSAIASLALMLLVAHPAYAALSFVEGFSDITHADLSTSSAASSAVWNSVDGVVQAGVSAQGNPDRRIDFGNGSDGVLDSSNGYVFDTDNRPVYNFRSVRITGGTITVTGSKPLIIRSLGPVHISSPIDVSGGTGAPGNTATSATEVAGGTGGEPVTSLAAGGAGGISRDSTETDREGTKGKDSAGVTWSYYAADLGNIIPTASVANRALDGHSGLWGPDADFDRGIIIAGDGGAGGGAYLDVAAGSDRASGAGGGAGGGVVHITALGSITFDNATSSVLANGGDGGEPTPSPTGTSTWQCGAAGGGGAGGAIWLQTFKTITTTAPPLATGGVMGSIGSGNFCDSSTSQPPGEDGNLRGDQTGGGAAWSSSNSCPPAGGTEQGCDSSLAAPNETYEVSSLPYDLKTDNAYFPEEPQVTQSLNGGSIQVLYSGSADSVGFSSPTPFLRELSYLGYRYLKIKITIMTAAVAGPSPTVARIAFSYDDAGPGVLPMSLSFGCGSLIASGTSAFDRLSPEQRSASDRIGLERLALYGAALTLLWLALTCWSARRSKTSYS